jgi:hypothetical protein
MAARMAMREIFIELWFIPARHVNSVLKLILHKTWLAGQLNVG